MQGSLISIETMNSPRPSHSLTSQRAFTVYSAILHRSYFALTSTNGAKDRNQRYLKLAGVSPEDFPDTQVHETWAVIKKNLEKLVEEELDSKIFQSLQATVASEFGYDDAARVNKNIDGITRLIELAYEGSHRIPTLEKIVEMVTQLHCG